MGIKHYKYSQEELVAFLTQEMTSNEELIKDKVRFGFYDLPAIVGLALGTNSLERVDYINSIRAQEKQKK